MRALLAVGLTAAILARPGFFAMFSGFAPWDDEGYVLLSLREYLRGGALYDQVYSQYGPAYYELAGLPFRALGLAVTHDAGRWLTLGVWLSTAALSAVAVHRLTRRLSLALCAQLLVFAGLSSLRVEPPHPGGFLCLPLALAVLAGTFLAGERVLVVLTVLGVLEGVMMLVKLNVGGFALAASVAALLPLLRVPPASRAALPVAAVAALLAPLLPMAILWNRPSVRAFATIVVCTVLAVETKRRTTDPGREHPLRALGALLLGVALAVATSLAVELARGTTISGLVRGVVLDPLRHPHAFFVPPMFPPTATRWALASLVAAAVCATSGMPFVGGPVYATLQIAAGAMLWKPFLWPKLLDSRLEYLPLLWLAIPTSTRASDPQRLGKTLLVLLAALQALHAYPVAGSQASWGTFLLVPAGAVAIAEGWAGLRPHVPRVLAWAGVAGGAVLVAWTVGWNQLRPLGVEHDAGVSLALPGAEEIHVKPSDAALYQWLAAQLTTRCTSFVSMPGFNSLYFFTGMNPPTRWNAGAWPVLFDRAAQMTIRDRFAALPAPRCAVRNTSMAGNWLEGRPPGDAPLADYIATRFVTVARRGDWEFMVEAPGS